MFFFLFLSWFVETNRNQKPKLQFDTVVKASTHHRHHDALAFIYDEAIMSNFTYIHLYYIDSMALWIRNERLFPVAFNWSRWMEFKWNLIRLNWARALTVFAVVGTTATPTTSIAHTNTFADCETIKGHHRQWISDFRAFFSDPLSLYFFISSMNNKAIQFTTERSMNGRKKTSHLEMLSRTKKWRKFPVVRLTWLASCWELLEAVRVTDTLTHIDAVALSN